MSSWPLACMRKPMALTAEGRALTAAHARQQLAIAARAERTSRALWRRLDVDDLDRSQRFWLPAQVELLRQSYGESQDLAGEYVEQYRSAEARGPTGPFVAPAFPAAVMAATMRVHGPLRVKNYIGKGVSPAGAHGRAVNKFAGMVRRQTLMGGRMAIDSTTGADRSAVGWRRVTGSNPCTFCAMLAGRGPVYGSSERASQIGGTGLGYHGHCKCTAEIVYGEWIPSDAEQLYIEEYEKAAAVAEAVDGVRIQETVLWRMRENGVFRDSPLSRNK